MRAGSIVMMKRGLALAALLACVAQAMANNIRVANVRLQNQDTNARTAKVAFDLAWDNCWRGAENWDAAWVFVKFRAPGSNDWQHAELSLNSGDHASAADNTVVAAPDGKGVFVYRASGYTGAVNATSVKLRWNYGSNGYDFANGDLVEVSVHALEMVYIPEGAFYLGSGGNESSCFYRHDGVGRTTPPFLVSSEAEIGVSATSGNLYYDFTSNGGDRMGPISNDFPKGYAAFYCVKHELSQGQYADFLNKLTYAQATNRFPNYYGSARHTIAGSYPNYSAERPDRACNYISIYDSKAYTAWAALRPMTELEFEKACRGTAYPTANEYVWGTDTIMPAESRGLSGAENGAETVTNGAAALGGCCYGNKPHNGGDGGNGPLRVGIFATNHAPRAASGAGYYGALDLGGNVMDRPVTAGTPEGRGFRGTHGAGALDESGNAANADWPGSIGFGFRGGSWYDPADNARASDRVDAARNNGVRDNKNGWRAARTAP